MDMSELTNFATDYAAAWSGQDPAAFASFYAENGSLRINDGERSVGREAVEQTARGFMTAFPDMVVRLVEVRQEGDQSFRDLARTGPGSTLLEHQIAQG